MSDSLSDEPVSSARRPALSGRRRGALLTTVVIAVAAATLAIGAGRRAAADESDGAAKKPNLVLIVIDTLRADHLPMYGSRNTAPFLAELATDSVVFERAFSVSSWTAPATASLFTSLYPVQHGVLSGILATRKMQEFDENVTLNRIAGDIQTIPEVLREAGYATFGVSDNLNVAADLGFDQGFDRFVMTNYAGADSVNALLNAWQSEIRASEPYFVYVHYMDPHIPYHARDEWYEKPVSPKDIPAARYDSEIGYVDSRIRQTFERFGWKDDAIVCITSDHGEEFYDHGATEHGKTLYQEVVHVPLLWHTPGGRAGRVAASASLVDVLPTMRTLAGLSAHPGDVGVSLETALDPGARSDRTLFGHVRRQVYRGGQTKKSAIEFPWKLVWTLDADRELYDLVSDPSEKTNRITDEPKIAARLEKAIVDFEAGAPTFAAESTHTSLDTETLEKLRALGYVR